MATKGTSNRRIASRYPPHRDRTRGDRFRERRSSRSWCADYRRCDLEPARAIARVVHRRLQRHATVRLRYGSSMDLLVLGGTHFVGRAVVEDALARGWTVTTLSRGGSP